MPEVPLLSKALRDEIERGCNELRANAPSGSGHRVTLICAQRLEDLARGLATRFGIVVRDLENVDRGIEVDHKPEQF